MAEFASKYWSPVTEALKTLAAGKQGDGATLGQIKEQVRKQMGPTCVESQVAVALKCLITKGDVDRLEERFRLARWKTSKKPQLANVTSSGSKKAPARKSGAAGGPSASGAGPSQPAVQPAPASQPNTSNLGSTASPPGTNIRSKGKTATAAASTGTNPRGKEKRKAGEAAPGTGGAGAAAVDGPRSQPRPRRSSAAAAEDVPVASPKSASKSAASKGKAKVTGKTRSAKAAPASGGKAAAAGKPQPKGKAAAKEPVHAVKSGRVTKVTKAAPADRKRKSSVSQDAPPPEVIGEEEHYAVEAFVDSHGSKSTRQYKVRWEGYGSDEDCWLTERQLKEDLDAATFKRLLAQLEKKQKLKKK